MARKAEPSHIDGRQIVIPLWLAATIAISVAVSVGGGAYAYADFKNSVGNLVYGVTQLRAESVTKTDLKLFCFELEKNSKGVVCPGDGASAAAAPHHRSARAPRASVKARVLPLFQK